MKKFSFQRDLKKRELLNGKIYQHGGVTVWMYKNIVVSSFCEGTAQFDTVKETKEYIKTLFAPNPWKRKKFETITREELIEVINKKRRK